MSRIMQQPKVALLTDPFDPAVLEPVPNYACKVCAALGRQREAARSRGDFSMVSDCNVEIRQHPHEKRTEQ